MFLFRALLSNTTSILIILLGLDKNGNQQLLRFPPFHESLKHGINGHGRIVVVIAEGFARPDCMPPIERVRDIIAFSFQHAPLGMFPIICCVCIERDPNPIQMCWSLTKLLGRIPPCGSMPRILASTIPGVH